MLFTCLFKIAWRNILRQKRRSLLTLLILILGTSGLLLVGGFFEGLTDKLREGYIHTFSGHLQINASGYQEQGIVDPFGYMISDYQDLKKVIQKDPEVQFILPRLYFEGMMSTDYKNISVWAHGVDPEEEHRVMQHRYLGEPVTGSTIIAGKDLDPKDPYGIVVGPGLLKSLGLELGSSVSLITYRPQGSLEGANFHIRGIQDSPLQEVGDRLIRVPLKTAQELLGIPNQTHSLLVVLKSTPQTELASDRLQKRLQGNLIPLEFLRWEKKAKLYWQSKDFLDRVLLIVQTILGIIFFFSIANTINMALFERMREYGTMMALGNGRKTIFAIIFFEAAILGLFGTALGLGFGILFAKLLNSLAIVIPSPPPAAVNFHIIANILIPHWLYLHSFLLGFFTTMFASLIPGYRASHLPITKALGYV